MRPQTKVRALVALHTWAQQRLEAEQRHARSRRLDWPDVFRAAREAARDGRAQYNGGIVSASSYGYPWQTTKVSAVRLGDEVLVSISRSGARSLGWIEHPRHKDETKQRAAETWAEAAREADSDAHLVPVAAIRYARRLPCLDGEAFALPAERGNAKAKLWRRYGPDGKPTGLALRMPSKGGSDRYEHGATLAEIEAELAHKAQVEADRARAVRLSKREERRARLFARLSSRTMASYADARAVGHCDAGIRAWCQARGIDPDGTVALADLARDPNPMATKVALHVARQSLRAIRQGV